MSRMHVASKVMAAARSPRTCPLPSADMAMLLNHSASCTEEVPRPDVDQALHKPDHHRSGHLRHQRHQTPHGPMKR